MLLGCNGVGLSLLHSSGRNYRQPGFPCPDGVADARDPRRWTRREKLDMQCHIEEGRGGCWRRPSFIYCLEAYIPSDRVAEWLARRTPGPNVPSSIPQSILPGSEGIACDPSQTGCIPRPGCIPVERNGCIPTLGCHGIRSQFGMSKLDPIRDCSTHPHPGPPNIPTSRPSQRHIPNTSRGM